MRKKTVYRICLLLVIFSSVSILIEYFNYQKETKNTKIPSVEKIIKEKKDIDYKDSKEEEKKQRQKKQGCTAHKALTLVLLSSSYPFLPSHSGELQPTGGTGERLDERLRGETETCSS